jgi:hypothetical protein
MEAHPAKQPGRGKKRSAGLLLATSVFGLLYLAFIILSFIPAQEGSPVSTTVPFKPFDLEQICVKLLFLLFLVGYVAAWKNEGVAGGTFLLWYAAMWCLELAFAPLRSGGGGIAMGPPLFVLGILFLVHWYKGRGSNPRPPVPALLLLCSPVLAGYAGAGEQPRASVEARVRAAVAGLRSSDEDQQLRAAVELLRLGKQAEPAVPDLLATLRNSKGGLPAALALGRIGTPAVKPLVVLLHRGPEGEQALPLCALSWMGPAARDAAPAVRPLLRSKDANRVALAASTLARISPPDRPAALAALQQITNRPETRSELAPLLLLWLHPEDPGPLVTALSRELRTQSCMFGQINRFIGAYGLAELGPAARPAVPALREALADREPVVRALAAYALARASPADRPRAVRALLEIAGGKPGPGSLEFEFGSRSRWTLKRVEVEAVEAVVDVLLTQEPGERFPTSFILTWAKQGLRHHRGQVGEWLKAAPLSTSLAAEMVRRLDPEAARKARLLSPGSARSAAGGP